jgi:hypothetical protein
LLPTDPEAVQRRLGRQALVVRSVWFPTQRELSEWGRSGCPVYISPMGTNRIAIGPRLGAMWASVFSPRFVGEFRPEGSGTRVTWTVSLPRMTRIILGLWGVLVTGWGVAIALGLQPGGLLWWAIVTLSTAAAPMLGVRMGGRALEEAVPWIEEVLLAPDDSEDWM